MTETPNPFIQVPAVLITGANISTASGGLTRLVLFEDDGQIGHPRGCFVMTPETAILIADLVRKQQAMIAEMAKTPNATGDNVALTRPN